MFPAAPPLLLLCHADGTPLASETGWTGPFWSRTLFLTPATAPTPLTLLSLTTPAGYSIPTSLLPNTLRFPPTLYQNIPWNKIFTTAQFSQKKYVFFNTVKDNLIYKCSQESFDQSEKKKLKKIRFHLDLLSDDYDTLRFSKTGPTKQKCIEIYYFWQNYLGHLGD